MLYTADQLCRQYWEAEMRCDVDRILEIWAKDAEFHGPDFDLYGEADLREFFTNTFAQYPKLQVWIERVFGESSLACIEWTAKQTDKDGKSYRLRGSYHANADGRHITHVNVWFDRYDWTD